MDRRTSAEDSVCVRGMSAPSVVVGMWRVEEREGCSTRIGLEEEAEEAAAAAVAEAAGQTEIERHNRYSAPEAVGERSASW